MKTFLLLAILFQAAHADLDSKTAYSVYCAPCHGIDGKGNGAAANFVEDKSRFAKSDEALIQSILNGTPTGMPNFSWLLNEDQAQAMVKYLRETFGQ